MGVNAHTGILELEGIIQIKMCRDKIPALMERLDPTYAALKKDSKDPSKSPEEQAAAASQLEARESDLAPTYKQLALLYADLHEYVVSLLSLACSVLTLAQSHWSHGG